MVNRYITYIKENASKDLFDVEYILKSIPVSKEGTQIIENILNKKILNNVCVFYTRGKRILKKEKIDEIIVTINNLFGLTDTNKFNVYFNGFAVDTLYKVEIEKSNIVEVIGIPSGEVLFLDKNDVNELMFKKFVQYESEFIYWGTIFNNIFYYLDINYHKIKKFLDPHYEKPEKPNKYKKDDIVLCQGFHGPTNLNDKIGHILDVRKKVTTTKGFNVDVLYLVNVAGEDIWLMERSIKGYAKKSDEYIEKLNKYLPPNRRETNYIEDHEVDDDYHLNQLFKKTDDIKIGDHVFLNKKEDVLYQDSSKDFVNVWWSIGKDLGQVLDIKNINGHPSVKSSTFGAWYKMSGVKK